MKNELAWFIMGFVFAVAILAVLVVGSGTITGFSVFGVSDEPFDHVEERSLLLFDDMLIVKIPGVSLSEYSLSGSMGPYFGEGANGIRVKPEREEDIHIGDIVSFYKGQELIVHRVVEKGRDKEGIYFVTKGDNNLFRDGKIRFKDIEYVTIGVLW